MYTGAIEDLVPTVTPVDADDKSVSWSSTNETIVKVDGGKVTAIGVGTADVVVTTTDGGKTAKCVVTVTEPEVEPEGE